MNNATVILAVLDNGTHVQIGRVRSYADASHLYAKLDAEQSGWAYDARGMLRHGEPRPLTTN